MKTLITGATGFVGSAVARKLIAEGHTLRALVRPRSDLRNVSGLALEIFPGDLRDRSSLDQALAGCNFLFHVAADYRLWVPHPSEIYESNITGTRNIMLAALQAQVERIVYTSSVAVMGLNRDGSPADEKTPVSLENMIGHYKRSKFLAEGEVRRMIEKEGLPAVIVNPSTPVGPRDIKPTPTGRIIVDAASGRMPAFVDTGLNVVHVDDIADGHLLALKHGQIGERYILGGRNMTLKEILCQTSALVGRRPPRICLPHSVVFPIACLSEAWARTFGGMKEPRVTLVGVKMAKKRMFFSIEKARRDLGFQPRPAEEALRDAVDWFRQNGYLR